MSGASAREHFDVVVVGSGFGGSVMAYRLAEAGKSVCVLERGKPYPPHAFARSPAEMHRNFWDPSEGLQGLYDVWSFQGTDAIVSSGLGGGSLIYANVLLRKPEKLFVKEDLSRGGYESWPVTRQDLEPHYDNVEQMLDGQSFPIDEGGAYREVAKTRAFRDAARAAGYEWMLPKLAVSFATNGGRPGVGLPIVEPHPNVHGAQRSTCRLCGECIVGCATGSKNTLDYTYLSRAARLGASLRTRSEVRSFSRRERGGFDIEYVEHLPEHEGRPFDTRTLPLRKISADRLVLSAGTYGSTYLLLKNARRLPKLSRLLGTRVGGNGDFLSFAWKCRESSADGDAPRWLEPTRGPVITSAVKIPDALEGGEGRGFYIEDAGMPAFSAWTSQPLEGPSALRGVVDFARRYLHDLFGIGGDRNLGDALSRLIGPATATGASLPLLGMGRDVPDGRLYLDGAEKWLELDYSKEASRGYFAGMERASSRLARELGGSYVPDPLKALGRLITVHPLGGCPMGDTKEQGVVDAWGEVFGVPGLYVADGSVMPGPVGPNPALTIAALADRFAQHMLEA